MYIASTFPNYNGDPTPFSEAVDEDVVTFLRVLPMIGELRSAGDPIYPRVQPRLLSTTMLPVGRPCGVVILLLK